MTGGGLRVAGIIGVTVVTIIFLLIAFQAQGAPAEPGISLNSALTPGSTQAVTITFTSELYGLVPQNSIFQLGSYIIYSAETAGNGATPTILATNLTQAFQVTAGSGFLNQLTATVSVTVPSVCSGDGCVGFNETLTITAKAAVKSYPTLWFSPTVVVVFSSGGNPVVEQGAFAGQSITPLSVGQGVASPNGFYAQFYEALFMMVGLDLIIGGLLIAEFHIPTTAAGVVFFVISLVMAAVWGFV